MSSKVPSESAVGERTGLPLPGYARAAIYGVAWLPLLGLVAFLVPRFEDLFSNLRARAELPAVTQWVLCLAWANKALFFLPSLLMLALLALADLGVAGLLQRAQRESLYWAWFVAVIASASLAVVLVAAALLLPVLKMGTAL